MHMSSHKESTGNASEAPVAVLMPVYKEHKAWVQASIESILNQSWRPLHLYIAYDDPDGPLYSTLNEYTHAHESITLFSNRQNLGLVENLNCALKQIPEQFIARMDADDIADPKRIETQLGFLHTYNLDFTMTAIDIITEEEEVVHSQPTSDLFTEDLRIIEAITNISAHSTWLAKRDVFDRLNGYRKIDFCEDLDFLLRALQENIAIGRLGLPLLKYRVHSNSISNSHYREQYLKALNLHDLFGQGCLLKKESVDTLNNIGKYGLKAEDIDFAFAHDLTNKISKNLKSKHYHRCAIAALKGMTISRAFRKMFYKEVKTSLFLNKYQKGLSANHNRNS